MKPKVIVFDFWNTLVYDPSVEKNTQIARLLGFNDKLEFWKHLDKHYMHTSLTFYDIVKEIMEKRNLPEGILDEVKNLWEECKEHVGIFPDAVKTLERLKEKYKLALLSNTTKDESEETLNRFGLKKYFDYIIYSSDVGLSKPDPEIFKLVLKRFKMKPEEFVMIGDTLKLDIVPARMLGMKAILIDSRGRYPEYKGEDWYIASLKELKL